MTLLAINWANVGMQAAQLILCLSILVVLHEMGHFLPAKWFKCRVEKFYLFFDPWFSLFKKKVGDTVYGIGWLPFGGYVKISGMIDESMDKEQMKQPAQPYEFRSKPAWQRLIIMIGGVTVNLILGFFLFAVILWIWGERKLPVEKLTNGIAVNSISDTAGLKNGDIILSLDNKPVKDYYEITRTIILDEVKTIQIKRGNENLNLKIPEGTTRKLIKSKIPYVSPRVRPVIDTVFEDIARPKFVQNDLRKGDLIIKFNDSVINFYDEYFAQKSKYKNQLVNLTVLRNTDTVEVKAKTDSLGSIGFWVNAEKTAGSYNQKYSLGKSIPLGVVRGWETLIINVKNFKLLFTSKEVKVNESLGSFISIGAMFDPKWDWEGFWRMTALLSIVLAFMNMLPIPGLDGGHVVFTVYEMITCLA
jgi:regulator of sigma E protease